MKTTRKLLSILLAVLLLATTVAVAAVPASALDATGSCGTNLTYTFNSSTGALTITGTGSTIRSSAFKNCTEIKSVSIGSSVTSIGNQAFYYCTNLERVSLPSNLRTIDYMAFYECDKLEDILIPASVTAIGRSAFVGCAFKKVMIPSGVTSLDYKVFEGCLNLETVIIDTTLTTINDYAFNSCLALKDVYYKGSEQDWNNGVSIGRYNEKLKSATMHYNTASNVKLVQITLSASPASYGTVSGGGIYMTGESVTIKATPNSGYVFDGWYYRDNKISTNATYTFAAAADGALTADFRKARTCTVSVSASPSAGGTVTGGGTYTEGQTATVKATWNTPYTFEGWYNGSTLVSTKATYSFTVTGSVSLTAKYKKPTTFTITVVAEPAEGGTVTGGGTYYEGETVTLIATPRSGYVFTGWYRTSHRVSTEATYSFNADGDVTLRAFFDESSSIPDHYTVTAVATPPGAGTVAGSGDYANGTTATLIATPNPGYKFVEWYYIGQGIGHPHVTVSTKATITVDTGRTYYAEFEKDTAPDDPGDPGDSGTTPTQPENVCPWCGGVHEGFFQGIIGFFHGIFAKLFGARY